MSGKDVRSILVSGYVVDKTGKDNLHFISMDIGTVVGMVSAYWNHELIQSIKQQSIKYCIHSQFAMSTPRDKKWY